MYLETERENCKLFFAKKIEGKILISREVIEDSKSGKFVMHLKDFLSHFFLKIGSLPCTLLEIWYNMLSLLPSKHVVRMLPH